MPGYKYCNRVRDQQGKAYAYIKNPFIAPVLKFTDGIDIDDVQIASSVNRIAPDNGHAFGRCNFIFNLGMLQSRHLVDDVFGRHIFGTKYQFVNLVNVYYIFDLQNIAYKFIMYTALFATVNQPDETGIRQGFLQQVCYTLGFRHFAHNGKPFASGCIQFVTWYLQGMHE